MTWTASGPATRRGLGALRLRRHGPTPAARAVVLALAGLAVLGQIAFPLLHGDLRDQLTVVVVPVFAAAALLHAAAWRGARAAAAVVLAAAVGFAAEAVGVRTGWPFGDYRYTGTLGPELLGVPLVVPCAYVMLGYPALLVARRLVRRQAVRIAVGAWAFASWDLFLDPQMVAAGHWRWTDPHPALPGIPGVPAQNFLGWLAVAVVLMAVLSLVPERSGGDGVPLALWIWTWLSSTLADAAFFHRPLVALWVGVAMGLVGVPLLLRLSAAPRP